MKKGGFVEKRDELTPQDRFSATLAILGEECELRVNVIKYFFVMWISGL